MGVLIDTTIFIDMEQKNISISKHLEGKRKEEFFISAISASELLHGVHRAQNPAIRNRRNAIIEEVLASIPIIPIDITIARMHAQIWADLLSKGTIIGSHDLWIAASALAHGLSVATGNVREFSRIPGLLVECWRG